MKTNKMNWYKATTKDADGLCFNYECFVDADGNRAYFATGMKLQATATLAELKSVVSALPAHCCAM